MLVILCTEQVREVRDFEQNHYFALLRFTVHFFMMLCLIVSIAECVHLAIVGRCSLLDARMPVEAKELCSRHGRTVR